ncbi:hypothetical protein MNBD_ALPHA08-2535 [hydrothermal vent metagenome]|uniref:BPL/LPL catalytic domain-containing protein n=1 Tax=hydrothermal vent metagenome TaxID=652676 RepID=A0A3B0RBM1_9ZZZZ
MTDLQLPPLLNAIKVSKPFETSVDRVRERKSGAGDLFWANSQCQADFAVVLEPDVSRQSAVEMIPLVLVALADCLAALLPPQVAIQFRDNQHVIVNGGVAGGLNVAMAKQRQGSDIPDWLVLSIKLDLRRSDDAVDPGLAPDVTTLDEEGWEAPDLQELIETFARHFLSWMAAWDDEGFKPVARAWKLKAESEIEPDLNAISENVIMFESGTGK